MTNARQQLNNMWITGNVRIPDWEFTSRPNGVIHAVGHINQLREVEHKDITRPSLDVMGKIEEITKRTTGVSDFYAFGQGSAGNNTAQGLSRLSRTTLTRTSSCSSRFLNKSP